MCVDQQHLPRGVVRGAVGELILILIWGWCGWVDGWMVVEMGSVGLLYVHGGAQARGMGRTAGAGE